MIKVRLSDATPVILTFDGEVLECFFDEGGSKRMHVRHIQSIQLDAGHGDKHLLTIQLKREPLLLWVDDQAVANVNMLIGPVKRGMASPDV
jgi:hypothetical protein